MHKPEFPGSSIPQTDRTLIGEPIVRNGVQIALYDITQGGLEVDFGGGTFAYSPEELTRIGDGSEAYGIAKVTRIIAQTEIDAVRPGMLKPFAVQPID